MAEKKLTGKIPRERIRMMETLPPAEGEFFSIGG
jgi:hypothetical protein